MKGKKLVKRTYQKWLGITAALVVVLALAVSLTGTAFYYSGYVWHINDRGSRQRGPSMTPILKCDSMELGCGNMNLARLTQQAKANGIQAVVLESHRNHVEHSAIKSIQCSAAYLNQNF